MHLFELFSVYHFSNFSNIQLEMITLKSLKPGSNNQNSVVFLKSRVDKYHLNRISEPSFTSTLKFKVIKITFSHILNKRKPLLFWISKISNTKCSQYLIKISSFDSRGDTILISFPIIENTKNLNINLIIINICLIYNILESLIQGSIPEPYLYQNEQSLIKINLENIGRNISFLIEK
ncbi:hypothetical protein BpHYR1_048066 [Brachionus plicatilis]|uniref:Uncharacterized protein n=1 Tax=Brachionus plicatilis TaxID=10195 RepID=A0A3M7S2T7_BRAPC|nr:hypothetical protein BpHYR1_048066 [Brachionus plicatilis]